MKDTEERKREKQDEKRLNKLLRTPDVKKDIKALKKEGKYDEIFLRYGRTAYTKYVPVKHQRTELKKLKAEGKYEDIFSKYGEAQYNKVLISSMYNEIRSERGSLQALLWLAKKRTSDILKMTGLYTTIVAATLSAGLAISNQTTYRENLEKYAPEIEAYNEKVDSYANTIKTQNLSDTQIMMKVMKDMWGSIKGYKTPENEIQGFLELNLATEEGYGVCRNMASDVAKKLNAINPKYNARTVVVRLGDSGNLEIADIQRNIVEDDPTVAGNEEKSAEEGIELPSEFVTNLLGNHMVTFVDIPEDNIILVIDPTNPSLGIYKDGEIHMFNSVGENGLEYEAKEFVTAYLFKNGAGEMLKTAGDYIKSFESPRLSNEELENKYGIDAQRLALTQVRALDIATNLESELTFDEQTKIGYTPRVQSTNQTVNKQTERER